MLVPILDLLFTYPMLRMTFERPSDARATREDMILLSNKSNFYI